jgi:antitoxin VapB
MAMNIKDPEAERLAAEVARRTGQNKTAAVREALRAQLERLSREETTEERADRMLRFLQEEIWPLVSPENRGRRITKEEREEILGYGPGGV